MPPQLCDGSTIILTFLVVVVVVVVVVVAVVVVVLSLYFPRLLYQIVADMNIVYTVLTRNDFSIQPIPFRPDKSVRCLVLETQ